MDFPKLENIQKFPHMFCSWPKWSETYAWIRDMSVVMCDVRTVMCSIDSYSYTHFREPRFGGTGIQPDRAGPWWGRAMTWKWSMQARNIVENPNGLGMYMKDLVADNR